MIENTVPGYELLQAALQRAYDQAARTKGAERHANDLPFHKQPMQTIADNHGIGFIQGQIEKKNIEAGGMVRRGEHSKAVHELLGVINYAAGAIIKIETELAARNTDESQAKQDAADAMAEAEARRAEDKLDDVLGGIFDLFGQRTSGMPAAMAAAYGKPQEADDCTCPGCTFRREAEKVLGTTVKVLVLSDDGFIDPEKATKH